MSSSTPTNYKNKSSILTSRNKNKPLTSYFIDDLTVSASEYDDNKI
jgi:hypothetical protein